MVARPPTTSPTHLETMIAAMTGNTYSRPPVTSIMMTTSDTVDRVTPASTAAAPTIAYTPGVMHCVLLAQSEKIPPSPTDICSSCRARPAARPSNAPMTNEGMRIPPGTGALLAHSDNGTLMMPHTSSSIIAGHSPWQRASLMPAAAAGTALARPMPATAGAEAASEGGPAVAAARTQVSENSAASNPVADERR